MKKQEKAEILALWVKLCPVIAAQNKDNGEILKARAALNAKLVDLKTSDTE